MEDVFLPQYFPRRWEWMDCRKDVYKIFLVDPIADEYYDVVYNIQNLKVRKVCRIQYPLAYMRYIIEGERAITYFGFDSEETREEIIYHVLHVKDLSEAVKANFDTRYYKFRSKFSNILNFVYIPSKDHCLVLLKKRGMNPDLTNSKNHYPMYVIFFHSDNKF